MKTMGKKLTSFALAFALALTLFTGCAQKQETPSPAPQKAPVSEKESATVTDQFGRKVVIPEKIEKIVSCYYTSTSTLVALGQADKLAGVEMKANTRELYKKAAPKLTTLPSVGNKKTFNAEACLALKPDLVIVPQALQDFIPTLEQAGVTVLGVAPETQEGLEAMISLFGEVIGGEAKTRADKLLTFYHEKMNILAPIMLKSTISKVYLASGSSLLSTATGKMYQNDLISLAGGMNAASELKGGTWTDVSAEQLIAWNPETLLMVQGSSFKKEDVLSDKRLAGIDAVKNKKVYLMPSTLEGWDYPTPSAVLGVLWTANLLHPDVVSTEQLKKAGTDFYKQFYNIDVTDAELGLGA